MLQERYRALSNEIRQIRPSANLLAVTKGRPVSAIRELFAAGQKEFGESYWQELEKKHHELADLDLHWHFIGRLQSNKCASIANTCSWVHSVCHLRHAKALSEARLSAKGPLSICVQVNVSGEPSKDGLSYDELIPFVDAVALHDNLSVRGLMTMLPHGVDQHYQQEAFSRCAQWARDLEQQFEKDFSWLSMGMSGDYQEALKAGARWCRLGSALFP